MAGSYQQGYDAGFTNGLAVGREDGWSQGFREQMQAEAGYTKQISDELDDMYEVCGDLFVTAIRAWKTGRCKTAEQFREQLRELGTKAEERIDFDELFPDDKYNKQRF